MSMAEKINREELQEIAGALLSEIYGTAGAASLSETPDVTLDTGRGRLEFSERDKEASKDSLYSPLETEMHERRSSGTESMESERKTNVYQGFASDTLSGPDQDTVQDFLTRLSRKKFLEQRLLRRAAREYEASGLTAPDTQGSGAVYNGAAFRKNLTQSGLPEELSDMFRKDSRRYDGAFEKY